MSLICLATSHNTPRACHRCLKNQNCGKLENFLNILIYYHNGTFDMSSTSSTMLYIQLHVLCVHECDCLEEI